MKPRTRRNNNKANEEQDGPEADDASSYSGSPVKEKENVSPTKGRLSSESYHEKFVALLEDFDNQVKLNKTDIHNNIMLARDSLTLPFKNAVMKMPAAVRNMEWGDYLKMKAIAGQGTSVPDSGKSTTAKSNGASNQPDHEFAVPVSSSSNKLETPAIRTSSRTGKGKMAPFSTPKFDPKTPASALPTRLPKAGEILMSISGSPVAVSASSSLRETARTASSDEDMFSLMKKNPKLFSSALRNHPDLLSSALSDAETRKVVVAAYNASLQKK